MSQWPRSSPWWHSQLIHKCPENNPDNLSTGTCASLRSLQTAWPLALESFKYHFWKKSLSLAAILPQHDLEQTASFLPGASHRLLTWNNEEEKRSLLLLSSGYLIPERFPDISLVTQTRQLKCNAPGGLRWAKTDMKKWETGT